MSNPSNSSDKDKKPISENWKLGIAFIGFIAAIAYLITLDSKPKDGSAHREDNAKPENPPNPPPVMATEHSPENQKHSKETWNALPIWVKFERVFRAVEFVVLVVGVPFVVFQGCEIQKSTNAAVTQAQLMQRQLDEMRKSREGDQRAWVVSGQGVALFDAEAQSHMLTGVSFNVPIKNIGRTPAINVVTGIGEYFKRSDVPTNDPYPAVNSYMLSPSADVYIPTKGFLSDTEVYDFITNGGAFYIEGTIWYDDIFGHHHWTQFCITPNADMSRFAYTDFHNTCDDAQTKQP
jgi:hypothetical protein